MRCNVNKNSSKITHTQSTRKQTFRMRCMSKNIYDSYMSHMHGEQKRYSCSKCGLTHLSERSMKRLHQNPKYTCRECDFKLFTSKQLKIHNEQLSTANFNNSAADVTSKLSIQQNNVPELLTIPQCPVQANNYKCDKYGTSNIIKETVQRHHHKQNVVCIWCDRRFCLIKHLEHHHIEDYCGAKRQGPSKANKILVNELNSKNEMKTDDTNTVVAFHAAPRK